MTDLFWTAAVLLICAVVWRVIRVLDAPEQDEDFDRDFDVWEQAQREKDGRE